MNRIDFTQPGGFPLTQNALNFMQSANAESFEALAKALQELCGSQYVILSGCVENNNIGHVGSGYVAIYGDIMPFHGGIIKHYVSIVDTTTPAVYKDGSSKNPFRNRHAQFATSEGIPWSDFKRITQQQIAEQARYGYGMKRVEVDASDLDENTYFPVTIQLPAQDTNWLRIDVVMSLNDGATPSWATHARGFSSCYMSKVIGCGWGSNPVPYRQVEQYNYLWATKNPVIGNIQLVNSSTEVIYVRGGAKYSFYVSHNLSEIVLRPHDYDAYGNQTVQPIDLATADTLIAQCGQSLLSNGNGNTNLLNIGESGTWTPSGRAEVGRYQIVGNRAFINITLNLNGGIRITGGLPRVPKYTEILLANNTNFSGGVATITNLGALTISGVLAAVGETVAVTISGSYEISNRMTNTGLIPNF